MFSPQTAAEFDAWLALNRYPYGKRLADGRIITVNPMAFHTRLQVSQAGDYFGYAQGWDYPGTHRAILAAVGWDGAGDPPDGWERHIPSTRYRPDGDPARECLWLDDIAVDPVTLEPIDQR